eukprot:s241_g14.t1
MDGDADVFAEDKPCAAKRQRRKCKRGSLADLKSKEHLPAGPADVHELFNYPEVLVHDAFKKRQWETRFRQLLQDGLIEHSDYSGVSAEREAKRLLFQVLEDNYNFPVSHCFLRACDIDSNCQDVLIQASDLLDGGRSCVFTDIRAQVHPEAQAHCEDVLKTINSAAADDMEASQAANQEIFDYLMQNGEKAVSKDSLACPHMLLSAGLSRQSLVWVGPEDPKEIQAEFEKTFEKRCVLSGSLFFRADEDEVTQWCQETLRRKSHFGPMPKGYKLWRKLFTPGQLQRVEQYRGLQSEQAGIDGTFICDLDHWPNSPGPQPGPFFPTLLRHGTIVDLNTERIAMSSDRFLALGFHIGPVSPKFQWPLAEYVLSLPDRRTGVAVQTGERAEHLLNAKTDLADLLMQDSRALTKRPASQMQEGNADGESAPKMARFGKLDTQHFKLLDALPKDALPDHPPAGKHQYTLQMGEDVKVIVKLSAKAFVLCHVTNGRSMSFHFRDETDVALEWNEVVTVAASWKYWPEVHCPRRPRRSDDPPLPLPVPPVPEDQQLEPAAAGRAPLSADDESETKSFHGDGENSDSSDASSSHWGDGGLYSAADRPFLRRAWPLPREIDDSSSSSSATLDPESSDTSSQDSEESPVV